MMYVVLVDSKTRESLSDLVPELKKQFPKDTFTIEGTEAKGYKLKLEGTGDEKAPRAFAKAFLKKWKPKPPDPDAMVVEIIMPKETKKEK